MSPVWREYPMMTYMEPYLVSTREACFLLGIKRSTLFKILRADDGLLERRKIGRKTLVTLSSIRRIVAGRVS